MNKKPHYRKIVNAIIVDKDNNFLLIQKVIYKPNQWSFVGGGVDKGETSLQTIMREIEEELGTGLAKFQLLGKSKFEVRYDFTPDYLEKVRKEGSAVIGQKGVQFVFRFKGSKDTIRLPEKELRAHIWVSYNELQDKLVFPHQFKDAQRVIKEFSLH